MKRQNLEEYLNVLFMRQNLSDRKGLTYLFSQLADAESSNGGEIKIFEQLIDYVQDPGLKKVLAVHKADEERHEKMFLHYIELMGTNPITLGDDQRVLSLLERELGLLKRPVKCDEDVVQLILLLQVIEERAIQEFEALKVAFEKDLVIVNLLETIIKDERKHLVYCQKVATFYQQDSQKIEQTLNRFRKIEEYCYRQLSANHMTYCMQEDLIKGSFWRRFWGFMGQLGNLKINGVKRAARQAIMQAA
ncbi:MAG: ferritin-like domain-containing protein [Halobacteriovoraceae bacterium]|nr:ferritin-like domain-containing protein [Halobacteriovoraceae bacterium]MBT5094774.1 ferritin-like domain-containing protein [Halobacteriovoraceae bacterium]